MACGTRRCDVTVYHFSRGGRQAVITAQTVRSETSGREGGQNPGFRQRAGPYGVKDSEKIHRPLCREKAPRRRGPDGGFAAESVERDVIAHEAAHMAVGGQLPARSYSYAPDGRKGNTGRGSVLSARRQNPEEPS
jgi:hypothetical protein